MVQGSLPLPRASEAMERGIAERLHLGGQLYVSLDGRPQADAAVGENRPGEALTPDHLMLWLSATKPVTAVAVGQLWERRLLALDDPIARFIPEFAQGGKEEVTVRHALTHTGGFRMLQTGWPDSSWEEILAKVCRRCLEPRWVPGEKAGYHLSSSWFVLGEIVQRLDGRPFSRYVREEIFEPLGAGDSWIGMPAERMRAYREPPRGDRLALVWSTEGWPAETAEPPLHPWHEEAPVTRPSPGGNGRGPMRELGRFYEALLAGGTPLLAPQTVEAMTARQRSGMRDQTFGQILDWGLGFILDSKHYGAEDLPYGYGPHASRRSYGHGGYRSTVAFADPRHRLVVALAFNGTPSHGDHERRTQRTLGAIYEDLGLAPGDGR